jgi:hypothetical protein
MAYTGSLSPRDLQGLRVCAAQRSETSSEFESFSGARIQLADWGSSFLPCLLAVFGAPYARRRPMAPRIPPPDESLLPDEVKEILASLPPLNPFRVLAKHAVVSGEEIEKIASDEMVSSLDAEGGCCDAWPQRPPGT